MTMVEIIEFTTFVLVVFTAWMLCTQTVAVYRLFGGRFLDLGPFVWGNSSMNWIWWDSFAWVFSVMVNVAVLGMGLALLI